MKPFTIIIPARYASTRLENKLLADLAGKPVIQHTFEQAKKTDASAVYIATDHEAIKSTCESFGARVIMTDSHHTTGTDRLVEAVNHLQIDDETIIINVQADEPLIPVELINQTAHLLQQNTEASISTMACRINDVKTLFDPNKVKVVTDKNLRALYFSRAPVPWDRSLFNLQQPPATLPDVPYYLHIGIYGYRVSALKQFASLSPAPIEKLEVLEQLRAMWHGMIIQVGITDNAPAHGVDTKEDLENIRRKLQ